jgi:hypothetical protein
VKKPDPDHLRWAVDQRGEVQRTLLAVYNHVRNHHPADRDFVHKHMIDHFAGAAFSLWRAVFLAETFRDDVNVHNSLEAYLAKLIADNSVTFGDDKLARDWTVGYYLENAKLRVWRASALWDHYEKDQTWAKVEKYLHLGGGTEAGFTRYEWECAHYALRLLFKTFHPSTDLVPVPPQLPKPVGLEEMFLDKNEHEARFTRRRPRGQPLS